MDYLWQESEHAVGAPVTRICCFRLLCQSAAALSCQVADFQRQQQQRDHALAYDQLRRLLVDIQIGDSPFEDMPQEMRSRLYYVISNRSDLVEPLKVRGADVVSRGIGSATR